MLLTFLLTVTIFLNNETKLLAAVMFRISACIIYCVLLIGVFHSKLDLNERTALFLISFKTINSVIHLKKVNWKLIG